MGGGKDEPWLYYKGGMEVSEGRDGSRPGEVWQGRNGKRTGEAWEEDKGGMGGGHGRNGSRARKNGNRAWEEWE